MSMKPCDRAKALFDDAESLGLDGPTEEMVSEAINTAQSEAILHTAGPKAHERWYDLEFAGIDAITLEPRERLTSVVNASRNGK